MMKKDKIAIFDFDGTLTRHDTFITFAKFVVGRYRFYLSFLKSIPWLMLWKFGIITNGNAKQKLFGFLYKGLLYEDFVMLSKKFASVINDDLNPDIFRFMKRHVNQGDKVYIISASIYDWIAPWAEENGVSKVVATEVEVDSDGRLTGRFATPNCHGKEKVKRAYSEIPNFTDCESWGYGDSESDKYILEECAHPNLIRENPSKHS